MLKDVVGKTPPVTHVTTAEEGLLVSLDRTGGVDLALIATAVRQARSGGDRRTRRPDLPRPRVGPLGDGRRLPVRERADQTRGRREGGHRAKRRGAEGRHPRGRAARRHRRQPRRAVDPRVSDVRQFAAELFQVQPELRSRSPTWRRTRYGASKGDYSAERSVAVTIRLRHQPGERPVAARFSFEHEDAGHLRSCTGRPRQAAGEPGSRRSPRRRSSGRSRSSSKSWVFADPDRTERLVRTYNDAFNSLRPRQFDGSHLQLPGDERRADAAAPPEGRGVAHHVRRQHAARARRRGREDWRAWPPGR